MPNSKPDGGLFFLPSLDRMRASFSPFAMILAFIGGALVLFGTSRYGIGLSPDSVDYIYCARQLAMGEGLRALNNGHFAQWSPLYPFILSVTGFLGFDPLAGARWVNAALYAWLILAAHHLFRRHIQQHTLVVAGTISAVFCMHVVSFTFMAWSETLFALTVVLFCIQLNDAVRTPTIRAFSGALLWAALASLTRYVGVALIAAGVAAILVFQNRPIKQRLKQAALFSVASTLPVSMWMLRNWWLGDGFAGQRITAMVSLPEAMMSTLHVLSVWMAPPTVAFGWRMILLAFVVGGLSWTAFPRRIHATSAESDDRSPGVLMTVFGLYVTAIVFISAITSVDILPFRYLSVVFIPGMCILFSMFSRLRRHGLGVQKIGRWVSTGLFVPWLLYLSASLYALLHTAIWDGAGGYASNKWQRSATIQYLKSRPLKGVIYSNAVDALYILSGQTGHQIPRADRVDPTWCGDQREGDQPYLVWFNTVNWRAYMATPDQLGAYYTLSLHRRFSDGAIYVVQCEALQKSKPVDGQASEGSVDGCN